MRLKPIAIVFALLLPVGALIRTVGTAPFLVSEYSPRRAAYLANPVLMWTSVGSDVLVTLSYAILLAGFFLLIARLRHLPQFRSYRWVINAFMVFVACSGATNMLRIVSIWTPMYQFSLIFKMTCAVAIFPAALLFTFRTPAFSASVSRFFHLLLTTQQQGEKLRKSEEFLERTNRLAGIGGWELDLDTQEVTWSTETCRIHGAAPGYKPSLTEALSMYAPSARPIIIAAVEEASAGGPGWDIELPVIRFDGRHIWARTVGAAEFENGKAVRLSGAFQDVTAKVEAREALRQATERVALATDSGEIGIWDWDIARGVLTCDDWMYRLHGKSRSKLQKVDGLWRDHLHPEDKARVEKGLEDALHGLSEYDTEFRIIWDDGSIHTLRGTARVTRDEAGRALNMVGANWNVTESRQLLSQIAEQHERLRVTLHSIGDGVITTDADGTVEWLNPVAERLTGWSTSDALGLPLQQVFQLLTSQDAGDSAVNRLAQDKAKRPSTDALLTTRTGIEYGIESSAAPICNKSGDLLGTVLVFRDVTDKRRLMTEAADATKLQLRLKDEFLSHVSHELRSPLTSIYSFSSIIADDLAGETTPQQKEYLQIVLKNVVQLQSMIEDLLTVTQSREGKLSFKLESVSAVDTIVDALQTTLNVATKKNIQLSVGDCLSLPPVYADTIRLRQLLIILLDNAIKFTPLSGKVSVHISEKDSEFLLLQVKDTGCGVPVEKWALIFENLYQVTNATHADTSQAGRTGLGLGLHIARNLVHRQGGNIWVNSVPGEGSVFSFTIPIYSGQDLVTTDPSLDPAPRRRKTDSANEASSLLLAS